MKTPHDLIIRIEVEGVRGGGKTTVQRKLAETLKALGAENIRGDDTYRFKEADEGRGIEEYAYRILAGADILR